MEVTWQECRLRNWLMPRQSWLMWNTRADVKLSRRKGIVIGRMPIMLRSSRCIWVDKKWPGPGSRGECPFDPGGFVIRGTEKVIPVQEQLSKIEFWSITMIGGLLCLGHFFDHERKKKYVGLKVENFYLRHNSLADEVPLVIALKALEWNLIELTSRAHWTGSETKKLFSASIEESSSPGVHSQQQALEWIGPESVSRVEFQMVVAWWCPGGVSGGHWFGLYSVPWSECTHATQSDWRCPWVLTDLVLPHVPVHPLNLLPKAHCFSLMARRVLQCLAGIGWSRWPRLCRGTSVSSWRGSWCRCFEDLFKRFNGDLKRAIDKVLPVPIVRKNWCCPAVGSANVPDHAGTGNGASNWKLERQAFQMERAGITQVPPDWLTLPPRHDDPNFQSIEKMQSVRRVPPASQWGMLCPQTPRKVKPVV